MNDEIKKAEEFRKALDLATALTVLWIIVEIIVHWPACNDRH